MYRSGQDRIDPKRRNYIGHKKQQFANAQFESQKYPHRLNIYDVPPVQDISLEDFETVAISRLKGM